MPPGKKKAKGKQKKQRSSDAEDELPVALSASSSRSAARIDDPDIAIEEARGSAPAPSTPTVGSRSIRRGTPLVQAPSDWKISRVKAPTRANGTIGTIQNYLTWQENGSNQESTYQFSLPMPTLVESATFRDFAVVAQKRFNDEVRDNPPANLVVAKAKCLEITLTLAEQRPILPDLPSIASHTSTWPGGEIYNSVKARGSVNGYPTIGCGQTYALNSVLPEFRDVSTFPFAELRMLINPNQGPVRKVNTAVNALLDSDDATLRIPAHVLAASLAQCYDTYAQTGITADAEAAFHEIFDVYMGEDVLFRFRVQPADDFYFLVLIDKSGQDRKFVVRADNIEKVQAAGSRAVQQILSDAAGKEGNQYTWQEAIGTMAEILENDAGCTGATLRTYYPKNADPSIPARTAPLYLMVKSVRASGNRKGCSPPPGFTLSTIWKHYQAIVQYIENRFPAAGVMSDWYTGMSLAVDKANRHEATKYCLDALRQSLPVLTGNFGVDKMLDYFLHDPTGKSDVPTFIVLNNYKYRYSEVKFFLCLYLVTLDHMTTGMLKLLENLDQRKMIIERHVRISCEIVDFLDIYYGQYYGHPCYWRERNWWPLSEWMLVHATDRLFQKALRVQWANVDSSLLYALHPLDVSTKEKFNAFCFKVAKCSFAQDTFLAAKVSLQPASHASASSSSVLPRSASPSPIARLITSDRSAHKRQASISSTGSSSSVSSAASSAASSTLHQDTHTKYKSIVHDDLFKDWLDDQVGDNDLSKAMHAAQTAAESLDADQLLRGWQKEFIVTSRPGRYQTAKDTAQSDVITVGQDLSLELEKLGISWKFTVDCSEAIERLNMDSSRPVRIPAISTSVSESFSELAMEITRLHNTPGGGESTHGQIYGSLICESVLAWLQRFPVSAVDTLAIYMVDPVVFSPFVLASANENSKHGLSPSLARRNHDNETHSIVFDGDVISYATYNQRKSNARCTHTVTNMAEASGDEQQCAENIAWLRKCGMKLFAKPEGQRWEGFEGFSNKMKEDIDRVKRMVARVKKDQAHLPTLLYAALELDLKWPEMDLAVRKLGDP